MLPLSPVFRSPMLAGPCLPRFFSFHRYSLFLKCPSRCNRNSTLRSMRSFMKLGKQRPSRTRSCDSGSDTRELIDRGDSSCATSNEPTRTNSLTSLDTNSSDYESRINGIGDTLPAVVGTETATTTATATTTESQDTVAKPARKSKPKVCDRPRRAKRSDAWLRRGGTLSASWEVRGARGVLHSRRWDRPHLRRWDRPSLRRVIVIGARQ